MFFPGPLEEREIPLVGGGVWKADLVSGDGKIVGEVKTGTYQETGKPYTHIQVACEALFLLLSVKGAEKRLLVFTDPSFHDLFKTYMKGRYFKAAESLGSEILLPEIKPGVKEVRT